MRSLCASNTQDIHGPNGHDRSRCTPIPGAKTGTWFLLCCRLCLSHKWRVDDEDEDDDAAHRGKINSRDLNQAMRVRFGAERILHVRIENQVLDWVRRVVPFFPSRILSVTVWSEGLSWGVDCLGSGIWDLGLLYIGTLGLSWVWGTSPGLPAQWTLVLSGFWAWI